MASVPKSTTSVLADALPATPINTDSDNNTKNQKQYTTTTVNVSEIVKIDDLTSIGNNMAVCKRKTEILSGKLITSTTKVDYNKVAILLQSNDTELLEKYREKLKQHKKQAIQFIPGKHTIAMEQAFVRLRKQGIRFVTVCSEKLINNSPSKILKYNNRWHKLLSKNALLYVSPDNIFGNSVATAGLMTKCIPNENELRDIALGVYTLNSLMNNINGQSVIVQAGKVLGIESESESTIELIDRCIDLKGTPKGGILFKATKPYQRYTLLYPTINTQTILDSHTAKLSGIVVNANYCHFENMSKLIKLAERKNIFLMGI